MKVLLVTDSYPPEIRSASHLMQDLARYLVNSGFCVTVITTWPEYNLSEKNIGQVYNEVSIEAGVKVIRVKTIKHHNVSYTLRGISQILMPFQFLYKLIKFQINTDSIFVYSPPLPLALVGLVIKLVSRKRVIVNIQDLFPKNAIDLGVLKNKIAIQFFKILEKIIYKNADFLTVHSEGNLKIILDEYPELNKKFSIIHNWIDFYRFENLSLEMIDFREKWGVKSKYIAIFAGVIGPSQNLDLVLWIAQKIKLTRPDLTFLLVGDGSEKNRLMAIAKDKNLTNVNFQPFISRDEYIALLSICDIGLVSLSPKNKTPVVPGKILDYMAAGIPVVAFLQKESDGHQIIKSSQCGISADSKFPDVCLNLFVEFLKCVDDFKSIGESGRAYSKNKFTKESCAGLIKDLLIK